MRGFWVKSRLISIVCAFVGLGLGACGSGSKSAPEGRKVWAFLSAQSRQVATRGVILAAASSEVSRPVAPKTAAAPGSAPVSATPAKSLETKKTVSESPVAGASREAAFEVPAPNFPVAPVAPPRSGRSLQDFSGTAATPALPAPDFSAPLAPAPTVAFQGPGGGVIARPTLGGASTSTASGGSSPGVGASNRAAPSAPSFAAAPAAPAPAAAPAASVSSPSIAASAPISGSAPPATAPVPPTSAKAPAADGSAKSPESPPAGEAQGAPQPEAKSKTQDGEVAEAPSQPKSDGGTPMDSEVQLQSSSQAVVYAANTSGGLLGSQPPTYTMDTGYLMPSLFLAFGDDNEDLKNGIYTKDLGQEFFPGVATVQEGFFSKDQGLVCAPDPKGCEGRALRWFDLGPLPQTFKESGPYLYKLHTGRLKPEELSKKVAYVDVGIGAGNQIKMPQIAAKTGHVYYVVLIPEGDPIAIAPMELNLEDPGEYEQFEKFAMNKDYRFVRGIWVKTAVELLKPFAPGAGSVLSAPVKLRVLPTDAK